MNGIAKLVEFKLEKRIFQKQLPRFGFIKCLEKMPKHLMAIFLYFEVG
jgi:hypothetical protein